MRIGRTHCYALLLPLSFPGLAMAFAEARVEKILFVEPALRLLTQCELIKFDAKQLTCGLGKVRRTVTLARGITVWKGRDYPGVGALRRGDRLDIKLGLDSQSREVAIFIWANFVRVEGVVGLRAARNWVRIHALVPFSIGEISGRPVWARVDGNTVFAGGARPEDLQQGRAVIIIGERLDDGRLRATRIALSRE
jgi:Domain of unknown function (DUF5666)